MTRRGRPTVGRGEPTERVTARIPASLRERLAALAPDNENEKIRRALELWVELQEGAITLSDAAWDAHPKTAELRERSPDSD